MNIFYPDELPIIEHKQSIIETLQQHQVTIIEGETGSGKTTQIPKMCLEAFPDNKLLIGCTQPRRIATSTVAARVSEELGGLGNCVGYKIRFHDHTNRSTQIKFMTDGVLLAETRNDRLLSKYSILIIDEAHERSLNIDFLLGFIKQLIAKRLDLKVIITSATIDADAFSTHFNDAPIIRVAGRTFPINVRYNPISTEESDDKDGPINHCVQTVSDLHSSPVHGDILIFLPTERDIRECCRLLEQRNLQAIILPMYGRLPAADQKRIFQRFKKTKIVVATNVAETSITVPGIRYVIDSGLARISHYNVRAKTTSLPICKISKSSCDQRKGRAGRLGPGDCIRLFSEEDYEEREQYTLPEIKRSNLAEVILQMIALNLGDPATFPFIEPPYKNAIREGYRLLFELGAISSSMRLTKHGKIMAGLPIDPCISRVLIEAKTNNCLREIKIIASVLAIQDPRIRPADKEKEADAIHKEFSHPHSDFMVFINIWNQFHTVQNKVRSWSRLKKYCKANFLSFQRMREWFDLHDQLERILSAREGFTDNTSDASYEQIHRSLLAGFLRNIARKKQAHRYQGAHNKELMVFPGSHQFLKSGQWLLAASFIETNNLYALTVATIEPEWIENVGSTLCKYSWTNPRWQKKTGRVVADETVSLFGLILSAGRIVDFAKKDAKNRDEARDIFIQSALVAGDLKGTYPFLTHNLALLQKWQIAEEKLRVRNILVDDLTLHEFYAGRIPQHVYDQRTLNKFLKKKQASLEMVDDDVIRRKPEATELSDYPPYINIGSFQVRLDYHFEPGDGKDGVTFRLPVDYAQSLSPGTFDWLVPGLLQEKLTFLLKSLPKTLRKRLIPIRDTVDKILDDIDIGSGSFFLAIESSILKQFRLVVRRDEWSKKLPVHLQPRFLFFDPAGKELCSGRNLKDMQSTLNNTQDFKSKVDLLLLDKKLLSQWDKKKCQTWNFENLPKAIPSYTKQKEIAGFFYPTLVIKQDRGCVCITFETDQNISKKQNISGMLYLYRLQFTDQYKALTKLCTTALSGPSSLWLLEMGRKRKEIVDALIRYILLSLFGPLDGTIVSKEQFNATIRKVKQQGLFAGGKKVCDDLMAILRMRRTVQEAIQKTFAPEEKKNSYLPDKKEFFFALLSEIFPADFFFHPPNIQLEDIHRQLRSLHIRLERFSVNPAKDQTKEQQLSQHLENLNILETKDDDGDEEFHTSAAKYRFLVNEFKISLFSPEIKTRESVSAKKLNQLWRATLTKC